MHPHHQLYHNFKTASATLPLLSLLPTLGIPPDQQRMIYDGRQMDDKHDLAQYGVDGKDKTDPATGKTY